MKASVVKAMNDRVAFWKLRPTYADHGLDFRLAKQKPSARRGNFLNEQGTVIYIYIYVSDQDRERDTVRSVHIALYSIL